MKKKIYRGTKIVMAEPMTADAAATKGYRIGNNLGKEGYEVTYNGGYKSWSPKDVFDNSYSELSAHNEAVTKEEVDANMKNVSCETRVVFGKKVTFVSVRMCNGFLLHESSSCLNPDDYDEEVGKECCLSAIREKVWQLLGFVHQERWFQEMNDLSANPACSFIPKNEAC